MKIAIMQPYLFPYIGYYQLMNAVDEFVIYDNIKYTKKGWINRNRILVNKKEVLITVPLKGAPDYLDIRDRSIAVTWREERLTLINKIKESYRNAPQFKEVFPIINAAILFEETNLYKFLNNSLHIIKDYLEIETRLIVSSEIRIDHELKAEEKVLAICKTKKANMYFNSIGGMTLYNKDTFNREKIDLFFLKSKEIKYQQFANDFVPWLSIIDVMMFNSRDEVRSLLLLYTLI